MADFKPFGAAVNKKLQELAKNELFATINGDTLYEIYLAAFPPGTNPMFRTKTEHDCQCCRNFIRNYGNVVALTSEGLQSVWNVTDLEEPYQTVATAMNKAVTEHVITNLFRTEEKRYGAEATKMATENGPHTWNHFWGDVALHHYTKTPDKARGDYRSAVDVFQRTLDTIGDEHVQTVLGLIKDNNLYRGEEHRDVLALYSAAKRSYDKVSDKNRFVWLKLNKRLAGFKNSVIGTLVEDLAKGIPLDDAVRMFEAKVAPANYKRPKGIVTQKQVDDAMALISAEGYEEALERRPAKLSDVTINNVRWADNSAKALMKSSIANLLQASVAVSAPKQTAYVTIDDFLASILPSAKTLDVFVENTQANNLVTLTAPVHADAKPLFKWDNNFAWSYNGNIADSDMRRAVQARGGSVTGVFRFTHMWNYGKRNASLMDLHVFLPGNSHSAKAGEVYGSGRRVGWNNRNDYSSGGIQDVDYTPAAPVGYVPVENITFPDLARMPDGEYRCKIHNWTLRQPTEGGFKAEIEFGGQVFEYEYDRPLANKEWVDVATVTLKAGVFTIQHHLPCGQQSKDLWGIKTETFVPVQTVMNSPNHWDGNQTGNRHMFFLLEGCKNPDPVRGIYNEFLRSDLEKHRQVFELLGAKTMCKPTQDQLSGLGFSSTKKDTVVVRVDGAKSYTINF